MIKLADAVKERISRQQQAERVRRALSDCLGDLGDYVYEQIGDEGMEILTRALIKALR